MSDLVFFIKIFLDWLLSKGKTYRLIRFLIVVLATYLSIYLTIIFTSWNKLFFEALSNYNYAEFASQLMFFIPLVLSAILADFSAGYYLADLGFDWRNYLNNKQKNKWLSKNIFYFIKEAGVIDNPDQRLTQDLSRVAYSSLSMIVGLSKAIVTCCIFAYMLWDYSSLLKLDIISGKPLPGFLFYIVFVYCFLGNLFGFYFARSIAGLSGEMEKREANYRYNLMLVSEYAAALAFRDAGEYEKYNLAKCFKEVKDMFYVLLYKNMNLKAYLTLYTSIDEFLPLLILAPFYFSHQITLGFMVQITKIFQYVYSSLSVFILGASEITEWYASLKRLHEFYLAVDEVDFKILSQNEDALVCKNLNILDGNGDLILKVPELNIKKGDKVIIRGVSGCGKTTWLKILKGLYHHYSGEVNMPGNNCMVGAFLHLPNASLRNVLSYPYFSKEIDVDIDTWRAFGLERLANSLDTECDKLYLSQGEKQRLILMSLLFDKEKDWFLLDEPTSHLDSENKKSIVEFLLKVFKDKTLIIITHDDFGPVNQQFKQYYF